MSQPPYWQYPQVPPPNQSGPLARPAPPDTVKWAVGLMCAGAALSVVSAVVNIAFDNSTYAQESATSVDARQAVGVNALLGLVQVGLWLWMAWKTGTGRGWARVVSTVFFGFLCLEFLFSVAGSAIVFGTAGTAQSGTEVAGAATVIIVQWVAGLIALILLWRRRSNAFFTASKQARSVSVNGYGPPGYPAPGYAPPDYGQPGYPRPPQPYGQPPQQGWPSQFGQPPQYPGQQPPRQ
jgi:hypothetical protein